MMFMKAAWDKQEQACAGATYIAACRADCVFQLMYVMAQMLDCLRRMG